MISLGMGDLRLLLLDHQLLLFIIGVLLNPHPLLDIGELQDSVHRPFSSPSLTISLIVFTEISAGGGLGASLSLGGRLAVPVAFPLRCGFTSTRFDRAGSGWAGLDRTGHGRDGWIGVRDGLETGDAVRDGFGCDIYFAREIVSFDKSLASERSEMYLGPWLRPEKRT